MGLANGKICFLYPQDKENIAWASEHGKDAVAYIYNPGNKWMIWDESCELMQYEQIYFVDSQNEAVEPDDRLSKEEVVYVYVMRGETEHGMLRTLADKNGGFEEPELVRELLYCDLYRLSR